MQENNPNASYGEVLSHSEWQVQNIYCHPAVGSSVNPQYMATLLLSVLCPFHLAVERVPLDTLSLAISVRNHSLTSHNRFYLMSFETFIMLVNPLFIFFLWNRQDKDTQLACFTKKVLCYPNLAACLSAKSIQNIISFKVSCLRRHNP